MTFQVTNNYLPRNLYISTGVLADNLPDAIPFMDFDKDGFDLNRYETLLYQYNGVPVHEKLNRTAAQYEWIIDNELVTHKPGSIIIDHALIMARYGYEGKLRREIEKWSIVNPPLKKLLQITPKWGFDINLEYVNEDGTFLEILHLEYDSNDYDQFISTKDSIEQLVLTKLHNSKELANIVETVKDIKTKEINRRGLINQSSAESINDSIALMWGVPTAYHTLKVI